MLRIGIDAGAAYLKVALLDSDARVRASLYEPHYSNPLCSLKTFLDNLSKEKKVLVGFTGFYSSALEQAFGFREEDSVSALIGFCMHLNQGYRNIIDIGAKGSRLIELKEGRFKDFYENSLCAAGTGSFLDQQMKRLELTYKDIEGFRFIENPARIAARCSVFAKTDLIHRQQEGYSKEEMWNGLCRGMASTLVQTLLGGRMLKGKTLIVGGVAENKLVMEWLKRNLACESDVFSDAQIAGAIGAGIAAKYEVDLRNLALSSNPATDSNVALRPALELRKSSFPDFSTVDSWSESDGTEVRVVKKTAEKSLWLGIDVGSTSTKAVLVDSNEEIIADFYRKTLGDPVGASGLVLKAIEAYSLKYSPDIEISGAGTTGSGRRIAGLVIGADSIINEITAHAKGALRLDPDIQTIFEIGGQDSKYIRLEQGNIVESNLNYICAAGTGSFIEEQAEKLGIPLAESGPRALSQRAPYTSDRCTVFMEEDVERLLLKGFSTEEAMAAVLYSVVQNYLTKVVEKRPVQGRIAFQGATARNIGLVAAFENYLDSEILVSPYCHVLGAYGAALAAKERAFSGTSFRGIGLYRQKISLSTEECGYCNNHCAITFADIEGAGERPSWGYMCGKEPGEKRMRRDKNLSLVEKRERLLHKNSSPQISIGTVAIPMVLGFYTYLPFWRGFFSSLGFEVKTTNSTDEGVLEDAARLSSADFCLPVKAFYGHAVRLFASDADFVLLPHMFVMSKGEYYAHVCPYGHMFPSLARSVQGYDERKVFSPLIDVSWAEEENISELYRSIGSRIKCSRSQIKRAWLDGWRSYSGFRSHCRKEGKEALQSLACANEKGILAVGRPYSLYDSRVSSSLLKEIAKTLRMPVIPADFVPDEGLNKWQEHRMFWDYGQTILSGLRYASEHENVFPIYITHFACGPDSCLITMAEEIMKGKPFMILEVDEHSSAGGYTTRIEAFKESIDSYKPKRLEGFNIPRWEKRIADYSRRKVWIPPMHPAGARFFASVFRRHGMDAEALPESTRMDMNTGKSLTLGKECMPAVVTIGTLVRKLRENGLEPSGQAFFMPSSDGPCRFGQYVNLHRIILSREGFTDVAIINPSSYNSYAGLSQGLRLDLWRSSLYSDLLTKMRCRLRPYEKKSGETVGLYELSITNMEKAIEAGNDEAAFRKIVADFKSIAVHSGSRKPLVGIVGEIYVRCDPFSNENLIRFIEEEGGEVWLSPASEFLAYSIYSQIVRAGRQKNLASLFSGNATRWITTGIEHRLERMTDGLLGDRREPSIDEIRKGTERYLPFECGTEAVLTLGRAVHFAERDNAAVIVNASPFTCMPGTQTTALFKQVEADYGVPVINMFYDGEEGTNEKLKVYLRNLARNRS
ncbi:hypothetical protein GX441_09150 [bacterium]|nr:hypothetical protein [bacterium]